MPVDLAKVEAAEAAAVAADERTRTAQAKAVELAEKAAALRAEYEDEQWIMAQHGLDHVVVERENPTTRAIERIAVPEESYAEEIHGPRIGAHLGKPEA